MQHLRISTVLLTSLAALATSQLASAQSVIHTLTGGANDRFGQSVALLGDLDGDGLSEVMVGAWLDNNNGLAGSGTVHVRRGSDGTPLYLINGSGANDHMGFGSSGAGDANGDGVLDICAAADEDDVTGVGANAGSARIVSGSDGTTIRELVGQSSGDLFGWTTSPLGDVDGDGRDDVAIGSLQDVIAGGGTGSVRVISGATGAQIRAHASPAGNIGFGSIVGYAGDVNGDGRADVIVGAPNADFTGANSGSAYVFSGIDGTQLHRFDGEAAGDRLGAGVDGGIDFDLDGCADLLVGAPSNDEQANASGAVYVFSGKTGAELAKIMVAGADKGLGERVRGGGDVDGDGYVDFVATAPQADNGALNSGRVYAFSGRTGALVRSVGGGAQGFGLGNDLGCGFDVDGDGLADAVAGAVNQDAALVVSFRAAGLELVGSGSTVCGPRCFLNGDRSPRQGLPFAFIGSGFAAGSTVFVVVTANALPSPLPIAGTDMVQYVDVPTNPAAFLCTSSVADGIGSFATPLSIPPGTALVGLTFHAQGVGFPPSGCSQPIVATNGLAMTVLP
jgi:hypothetical protein